MHVKKKTWFWKKKEIYENLSHAEDDWSLQSSKESQDALLAVETFLQAFYKEP